MSIEDHPAKSADSASGISLIARIKTLFRGTDPDKASPPATVQNSEDEMPLPPIHNKIHQSKQQVGALLLPENPERKIWKANNKSAAEVIQTPSNLG